MGKSSAFTPLEKALRETYWQHTPKGSDDSHCLLDALAEHGLAEGISHHQLKAFFMRLPHNLFALAVNWGMGDSVFRDELHEFVEDNKMTIKAALLAACDPPEHIIQGAGSTPVIRTLAALQTKDPLDDVILNCWSCGKSMSAGERSDADGHCPHCDVEIELD